MCSRGCIAVMTCGAIRLITTAAPIAHARRCSTCLRRLKTLLMSSLRSLMLISNASTLPLTCGLFDRLFADGAREASFCFDCHQNPVVVLLPLKIGSSGSGSGYGGHWL
jgi:hypothetical protein